MGGDASEEKYREMTRVYEVYQELLREFGLLDHEEPFLIAMERVRKGECQLPERVVAEHFVDLSHLQEQLLVQLVSAGVPVSLHLGGMPAVPGFFLKRGVWSIVCPNGAFTSEKYFSPPRTQVKQERSSSWRRKPFILPPRR